MNPPPRVKFSTFLRQAWALTRPYFFSDQKWKARLLLGAIVALNLALVYMAVLFNAWYGVFYDALQAKDAPVFWTQMGRFAWLAGIFIVMAVYKFYLTQLLEVRWRAWMTGHYLQRWLANHAFYHLELMRFAQKPDPSSGPQGQAGNVGNPDNPDQRIQEDINLFTSQTIGLSMGLLNAVVTLMSFVGILWGLSGAFAVTFGGTDYNIPGSMVWLAVVYCLVGSVLTHFIGRPQIALNFQQQRVEADFRHHLVRVREYSESIALDRGETVERQQLDLRFGHVLSNYLTLLRAQKRLIWFTSFFGQAAVVFPFLVAAPRFFSGAIQLGALMQISSAFGKVQEALSWFVDSYSSLASWRATTDRLTSFEASFQALGHANKGLAAVHSDKLAVDQMHLQLPDGTVLLTQTDLAVQSGDSILLQGPSGSGKSTLFRALAGIWPFARGTLERPANSMFIPQKPYFPNGALRDALAYPESPAVYTDAELADALHRALLPQLADQLDQLGAWSQILSGGEQQRLAIARVLLKKPRWVFADEATSALDSATEEAVYRSLLRDVNSRQGALVSIAHQPDLARFHQGLWVMEKQPADAPARYQLRALPSPTQV